MAGAYQDCASSSSIPSGKSGKSEWIKTHKTNICLICRVFGVFGYPTFFSITRGLEDSKKKKTDQFGKHCCEPMINDKGRTYSSSSCSL